MSLIDQSMNRRKYDGCKTADDLRVTTGPGRYQVNPPNGYCDACFAPEPTIRAQKWGASMNSKYIKTDVESDLFNINRATTKTSCGQYAPATNQINTAGTEKVKECAFPQTFSRLVDPPCTARGTGWNRWEWLCDNPQETVMVPFDNLVTTRLQQKDQHRPCIPKPMDPNAVLPAPQSFDQGSPFESPQSSLEELAAHARDALTTFPRGNDTIPEPPSALSGVKANPVGPPSIAYGSFHAM